MKLQGRGTRKVATWILCVAMIMSTMNVPVNVKAQEADDMLGVIDAIEAIDSSDATDEILDEDENLVEVESIDEVEELQTIEEEQEEKVAIEEYEAPEITEETVSVDCSESVLQSGGFLSEEENLSIESPIMLLDLDAPNLAGAVEALRNTMDNLESRCNVSAYGIPTTEARALFSAVINSTPRFFYVQSSFSYGYSGSTLTSINVSYKWDRDQIAAMKLEYESVVNGILSGVQPEWSDMETALYFHDYLVDNAEYDLTYSKYSAYNNFVEKTSVCQGYALAYKELMDRANIPCQVVSSNSSNHAWNIAYVADGYYYIDTTWDDPTKDLVGRVMHTNFMKSYSAFNDKHLKTQDWQITENWPYDAADDTKYDSHFTTSVNAGARYMDGYWYMKVGNSINKYQFSNNNWDKISTLYTIRDTWYVKDGSGYYWTDTYSGFSLYKGLFYIAAPTAVYSIDPAVPNKRDLVYTLTNEETAKGDIYGLYVNSNGDVIGELSMSPNEDGEAAILCSVKKEDPVVETERFVRAQATIVEQICLDYKIYIPADLLAKAEKMEFDVAGEKQYVGIEDAKQEEIDGLICQVFRCVLTSTQMRETVTAKMIYSDGTEGVAKEYSVVEYLNKLVETYPDNTKIFAVANAMTSFGDNMSAYATGQLNNIVSTGLSSAEQTYLDSYVLDELEFDTSDTITSIAPSAISVGMGSMMNVKVKYESNQEDDYTFFVNGEEVPVVTNRQGDKVVYQVVSHYISPNSYNKPIVFSVKLGETVEYLVYSPMQYVKDLMVQYSGNENAEAYVSLVQSIVKYHCAIKEYRN